MVMLGVGELVEMIPTAFGLNNFATSVNYCYRWMVGLDWIKEQRAIIQWVKNWKETGKVKDVR